MKGKVKQPQLNVTEGRFGSFGEYLLEKRERIGLTQGEVARALGYSSPQFVSNWERGTCSPPFKKIKKIAVIYEIPLDELYDVLSDSYQAFLRRELFGSPDSVKRRRRASDNRA